MSMVRYSGLIAFRAEDGLRDAVTDAAREENLGFADFVRRELRAACDRAALRRASAGRDRIDAVVEVGGLTFHTDLRLSGSPMGGGQ